MPEGIAAAFGRRVCECGLLLVLAMIGCLLTLHRASAQGVPAPGTTFRDCPHCPEMVVIPPGSFLMGSTKEENAKELATIPRDGFGLAWLLGFTDRDSAERFMAYEYPQHPVMIAKPFALGKYPVTRTEFAAFVQDTGYATGPCMIYVPHGRSSIDLSPRWQHPGFYQQGNDPAVCISWKDAHAYIAWLNRQVQVAHGNGTYRLPSEAEWEYAARAGTHTARWWGDGLIFGKMNCNGCDMGAPLNGTVPVMSYQPNPFGLYNMLGNVEEVVEDCWHKSYVGAPSDGSPWLTGDCSKRSVRGDGWLGSPWAARAATRSGQKSYIGDNARGFRVARSLP